MKKTFHDTLNKIQLGHKDLFGNLINKKINCSALVYLSFKELEPNANTRLYYKQKEALLTSNNFIINNRFSIYNQNKAVNRSSVSKSSHQSILFPNSFLTDLKTNATLNETHTQTHSHNISEYLKYQYDKARKTKRPINLKHNLISQCKTKLNISNQLPSIKDAKGEFLSRSIINDSQFKYCYIDKETKKRNKAKKSKRRLFSKLIYDKVNELSISRISNEKKLFEIIDKCQMTEEPIIEVLRNDLEQIFDIQLKSKSKRGETKKAIIQDIKLNAKKNMMLDETKAKMIELSD